jgi:di/tricarboxylate transporter
MSGALSPASLLAFAGVAGGAVLGLADPLGLGAAAAPAGLVLCAITLFATGVVSETLTAIAFFTIAMIFAVAPPAVVFSGFSSNAFWLVFAGLIIGMSVNTTGLGARVARGLAGLFPPSYGGLVAGFVVVALCLAFFMPSSMGRIVLLMPIVLALADRYGLAEGTRGRAGLALIVGFACFNPPNGLLPATVPNMVFVGAVEKLTGAPPLYGEWMLLHFPLLGVAKAALLATVGWWLFRTRVTPPSSEEAPEAMSPAEKRLSTILALALIGWASDVVHGVSPAWIGMAAASLCLLPGIGVMPRDGVKRIDFSPTIYVAAILSLGALIADSGLGPIMGAALAEFLPLVPGENAANVLSLALGGGLLSLATTMPGLPAVMVPLSEPLAAASGLPLETVLATVVLSYSTTILPYQAPPLILAMGLAGAKLADATRLVLVVAVASLALILPATLVWWSVLELI